MIEKVFEAVGIFVIGYVLWVLVYYWIAGTSTIGDDSLHITEEVEEDENGI